MHGCTAPNTQALLVLDDWTVDICRDNRRFFGLGAIHYGEQAWRDRDAPPILPVTRDRAGYSYTQWQIDTITTATNTASLTAISCGEPGLLQAATTVYGHPRVVGANACTPGPEATLTITLTSGTWRGMPHLRLVSQIAISDGALDWILERHTWRPQPGWDGWRYFAQRWGCEYGGWDAPLDDGATFSTADAMCVNGDLVDLGQGQPRGYGGPAMDYCYGPDGGFALWRDADQPDAMVRGVVDKGPDDRHLGITDHYWGKQAAQLTAPGLNLVVWQESRTRTAALNHWTRCWDGVSSEMRAAAGIPMPEPVPALYCECWNLGSGRFFEHQRAQLPEIAARGIQRLILHVLPHAHVGNNCCALFDYQILESEGGHQALADFCATAKDYGIEVYGWGAGHLSVHAPIVNQHPDWFVREESGRRFDGGYPGILAALDFGHPEVQAWYIDQLDGLAQAGVAGMWLDSWMNLHAMGINAKREPKAGGPGPHLTGLLHCLRTLCERGMRFITEGISPLGLSAGNLGRGFLDGTAATGNLDIERLGGGPELLYQTSLWWRGKQQRAGHGLSADTYFAALAQRAPIALCDDTSDSADANTAWLGTPHLAPVTIPGYAAMHTAYRAVVQQMHTRELSTAGTTIWHADDGSVIIFSVRPEEITLDRSFANHPSECLLGTASDQVDAQGCMLVGTHSVVRISGPTKPER